MAKIKRNCLLCGKEFYAIPALIKRGAADYCSRKCKDEHQKHTMKGEGNNNWKGGKIKRHCEYCNETFETIPALIRPGKIMCCSTKCMGKWKSLHRRGEKSLMWKGGITPIAKAIRHSDKYLNWRSQVFIRDNFTCRKCGDKTSGNFHAHHIKSFSKITEEVKRHLPLFGLYDGAMLYAPLWDINNGLTLCKKCHSHKRHSQKRDKGGRFARRNYR